MYIQKKNSSGPKRCQMHGLGSFCCPWSIHHYIAIRTCKYNNSLVIIKEKQKKTHLGPKRRAWRRLSPLLSFLLNPSFTQLLEPLNTITVQLVSKISEEKRKKTRLGPKRRIWRRLGPLLSFLRILSFNKLLEPVNTIIVYLVS